MGESTVKMLFKNSEQIETYGREVFGSRCHCTNTVIRKDTWLGEERGGSRLAIHQGTG